MALTRIPFAGAEITSGTDPEGKKSEGRPPKPGAGRASVRVTAALAWATSELRTLELREGICPAMEHYGVTRTDEGAYYQRHSVRGGSVHVSGSMTIGGDKYQHDRGFLRSYCDRVVEAHEEPLGEALRAAGLVHLARKKRGGLAARGHS